MNNLITLYNTFTSQSGPNDCGPACLAMILKFAGKYREADHFISLKHRLNTPLSLLDMKRIAADFSLSASCVEIDLETLRKLQSPVILHTINYSGEHHFIICHGGERKKNGYRYLIADPATHMHFLTEEELVAIWPKSAALYFVDLKWKSFRWTNHSWLNLFRIMDVRKTVLISIPLLNAFATMLGVAFSWMLQRGINDSPADKPSSLIIAVILLLLIITLFRSGLTYVRQNILIVLNASTRMNLVSVYMREILCISANNFSEVSIRKGFADIQKIQNAITALVSVLLSDGCIISLLSAGLWYFEPIAGLINTCYLIAISCLALSVTPGILYRTALLNELSSDNATDIYHSLNALSDCPSPKSNIEKHLKKQHDYRNKAKDLSLVINRQNMWYECIGTISVVLVFTYCLICLRQNQISYSTLMAEVITSYFITSLMPRICNALPVITDGAQLARKYLNSK